jgi:dipeptidyl-peptidase-4
VPLDGDLFVAGLDGAVRRLTETAETELDAEVSGTGKFISFVRDQNLFVIDSASGPSEADAVAAARSAGAWPSSSPNEEWTRRRPLVVADDRLCRGGTGRRKQRQAKSPARRSARKGTRVFEQRYPAAGTPNAVVDLYVVRPDGSGRVKVDSGRDQDIYLARVDWAPDGGKLFVQRQSRDQKKLDLLQVDPATGRAELLFSETSPTWVNLHNNLVPLKDGSLIWSSERSGFQHLYRWRAGAGRSSPAANGWSATSRAWMSARGGSTSPATPTPRSSGTSTG